MLKTQFFLIAAFAGAALAPGVASAQWADPACVRANHNSQVEGTVFGALGGAVLGDVLGGRHGHGLGAGLGALGGAVVGNGMAEARNTPCPTYGPPPPPPPPSVQESYAALPPPPRPDDGLMHWAGSLQSRVARDHDAGLLTNGQLRRLEDQLGGIRQHYGDLRWRDGGYLYPEDAEAVRAELGGIDRDLHRLEVLGS